MENSFTVKKYNQDFQKEWNNFLVQAKNATFLFNRNFMDYHKDRFDDYSLLIFKNDKLVALLPANIKEGIIYSHQGLSYGGLVFTQALKIIDVLQIFRSLLKFLSNQGIKKIHLKLLPSIYSRVPNDELYYLLFILNAELTRRDVLSVIHYKEIPNKISKIRERGIKKAESLGLIIKESTTFDDFWNTILIPNLKQRFETNPVHTLDEIKNLKAKFPKNIRQFNIYKDDVIVGGTTIFETKNVAHAQYISANDERQDTGALDFLFKYLVFEEFKYKSYFDFGISNENQGQNINEGLLYWKESFGARTITANFYSLETKNYTLLNNIMK